MKTKDNFLGNLPIELTHALFRVAGSLRSEDLKKRIETWGIAFIESTALSNSQSMASDIRILEQLVILGETVGEIPYHSSKVLYSQFEKIKSAIRQYEAEIAANSAIDNLFTASETDSSSTVELGQSNREADVLTPFQRPTLTEDGDKNNELDNGSPITLSEFNSQVNSLGFVKHDNDHKNKLSKKTEAIIDAMPRKYDSSTITERQQLIVQTVRQLGNTAMKDLIAEFPSVSERTIRYDLQKLCEEFILERIGNGGPASFYHLREQTSEPISA